MTTPSLGRQIADTLRRDILTGVLAPGAPVKERDRAAELGVSRTPMREAIRILAEQGLVTLRPSRSPIVANPSLREVTDALTVMIALETLSGRLACDAATDEDLDRIRTAHLRMEAGDGAPYSLEFFEADMAFHTAVAAASHNPPLIRSLGGYVARLWRVRFRTASARNQPARAVAEHGEILAALEARDVARIEAAIEVHLSTLTRYLGTVFDAGCNGASAPEGETT